MLRPFKRGGVPPADPQEAADWWSAKQALGTMSPRDEAAFDRWLRTEGGQAAYDLSQGVQDEAAVYAAEPEILAMREQALNATHPATPRPVWSRVAAGLAVVLLAGGAGAYMLRAAPPEVSVEGMPAPPGSATKRYETRVGERREIRLDDGSTVALNTGSLLEVTYNSARRDVRLVRGQALFQVAHNRAWPFVVTAGDRRVTAVGTAFDVRLDGPRVRVVLVEGKVRIDPLQRRGLERVIPQLGEQELDAGEQLVAREGAKDVVVATADVQRAVSWKSGQVIFRDDSLGAAVAEMNRYSDDRILIEDPRVAALKVSGVFNADRPQNFVAAVTTFYPLRAVRTSAGATELEWRD